MSSFIGGDIADDFKRDIKIGFLIAVFFHAGLLFLGGWMFVQSAEYGVETGQSGMDVYLVAALPEESASEPVVRQVAPPEKIVAAEKPEMVLPEAVLPKPEPVKEDPEKARPVLRKEDEARGDGSSAVPGKDQTTFFSQAGAASQASPAYLKNPAPPYPESARRNGWEGVAVLKVLVNEKGEVLQVGLEKSSGYEVLDESALKTLRRWRFKPAAVGEMRVESWVRIPVRFKLTEA